MPHRLQPGAVDVAEQPDGLPFEQLFDDRAEASLRFDDTPVPQAQPDIRCVVSAAPDEAQLLAWVERIADHDEQALSALYDATLTRVFGLVLRIVRRHALAEEVVEDTYFQVWRQAARFDPARGRVCTWLLGMARSRAIDALRHEQRFAHDPLTDADDPLPSGAVLSGDQLLGAARGHAELHRAMMGLGAQPRQLVALAFFRGLSHEEIASQTALPLGTVKSQIRRALLTLRQALGEGAAQALAS